MEQERVLIDEMPKFVQAMADKIRSKTEQFGEFTKWERPIDFCEHFIREYYELYEELQNPIIIQNHGENSREFFGSSIVTYDYEKIMKEAIDVANLAFMIWWSAKYQQIKKVNK